MADKTQQQVDALEFALQTERDGREYYAQVARETNSPVVKATFEALGRDEVFHMRTINEFMAALKESGQWTRSTLKARVSDLSGEIVTMFREAMESDGPAKATDDDTQAYEKATEFERKGAIFYQEQADGTADEDALAFWQFLAAEENKHLRLIQETLAYLDNPADFHLTEEKGMLDAG